MGTGEGLAAVLAAPDLATTTRRIPGNQVSERPGTVSVATSQGGNMTTITDRPVEPPGNDTTRGDQVLGAIGGLVFVLCALGWMAYMLWYTIAGR